VAGILLAFTVPLRQKTDVRTFTRKLFEIADEMRETDSEETPLLTTEQIEQIDDIEEWVGKVQSPLQHTEHVIQNWVAFIIMPIFAFFNAGVVLSAGIQLDITLISSLALSLFLGKTIGVSLFSYAAVRMKVASLPAGVSFGQIFGVALLAGVGFTMAVFIANLAFTDAAMLMDSAKAGILAGSAVSGISGYLMLRYCRQGNSQMIGR